MRKLVQTIALAAAVGSLSSAGAGAQTYPSRPVTLVVPLATGGSTDVIGRLMAEAMRPALGQPVIVENTAGAGGTIGVGRVARSAPDGYTFLIGQWGTNVASGAIYPLQFDLLKDLEPVALIATQPFLIVSRKTMPANNLTELIAWLKANADKASQGNSGIGTPSHVGGILFQTAIGTRFQLVPYRSAGLSMQDLVAGNIDVTLDTPAISLPQAARRQHQGLRGHRQEPARGRARDPDHRRGRNARLLFLILARALGTQGHAEGDRRQAQRRCRQGAGRPCHAREARRSRAGDFPARAADARGAAAFQKAEIEKWWPIIQAAGIKAQ